MIIPELEEQIEHHGIQESSGFTIKSTAKAFKILSSNLYTDPILAIVRELSCNAYDSHKEANKPCTPFIVHLPNAFEPFFSIADIGTGLSKEQIFETYTTYFESSKTESDDYIGALGLGSKSPFSYKQRPYEVISNYCGTKTVYSMFINSKGLPDVALLSELTTAEPNGIEVRITADSSDFQEFALKTKSALKFFITKPTVTGGSGNFSFPEEEEPCLAGEDQSWSIYGQRNSLVAVMGQVNYQLSMNMIKPHLTSDEFTFANTTGLVIFYDIGTLEVAASRENLQYDERTLAALVAKIKIVYRNLAREFALLLHNDNTGTWDTLCTLKTLTYSMFGNNYNNHIDWRYLPNIQAFPITRSCFDLDTNIHVIDTSFDYWEVRHYKQAKKSICIDRTSPVVNSSTGVYIDDIKTGGCKRIFTDMANHRRRQRCLRILSTGQQDANGESEKELSEILKLYGTPTITRTSSLPAIQSTARRKQGDCYQFIKTTRSRYSYSYTGIEWKKTTLADIDSDNKLYVHLTSGSRCSFTATGPDSSSFKAYDLKSLLFLINSALPKTPQQLYSEYSFVGVPDAKFTNDTFMDNTKGTKMIDAVAAVLRKYKNIIPKSDWSSNKTAVFDSMIFRNYDAVVHGLPAKSKFEKLYNTIRNSITDDVFENVLTNSTKYDCLLLLYKHYSAYVEPTTPNQHKALDTIMNKYSMLTTLDGTEYQLTNNKNIIIEYINTIDNN